MEPFLEEPRTRITARVSDIVRTTLEQAAELSGATVNQFVVQTAYLEAQRLIERETVIRLSQSDARRITDAGAIVDWMLGDDAGMRRLVEDAVNHLSALSLVAGTATGWPTAMASSAEGRPWVLTSFNLRVGVT